MEATEYLMKDVRDRVSLKGLKDGNELRGALKDALYDLIKPLENLWFCRKLRSLS